MNNKIFIPRKIKVGYQNRKDTYTGKLAYIIYYDEKGKLRKECSWKSWRKNEIEPDDYNNEPLSGFVLNKKSGGYSTGWNHRQTYCRVYDPRGFEFEITIPNLLYILDNCNSIKGKGLECEFVYGWDGTELLLIPINAPDYRKLKKLSDTLFQNKKFNTSNMIVGATYLTKQNEQWIYMGRFAKYQESHYYDGFGKSQGKYYFFYHDNSFHYIKSTSNKIVDVISEECVKNYAGLMDKLEHKPYYSPHDHYEYVELNNKELSGYHRDIYVKPHNEYYNVSLRDSKITHYWNNSYDCVKKYITNNMTIEDMHAILHFCKRNQILKNGKTAI